MKKLVLDGLSVILVACLLLAFSDLFSRFTPNPSKNSSEFWSNPNKGSYESPSYPHQPYSALEQGPEPCLISKISISEFEPPQLGGEAMVTVTLTTNYDASNVTTHVDIAKLELIAGNSTWTGELKANIPKNFSITVRAFRFGVGGVEVIACWYQSPAERYWAIDAVGVYAHRDGISIIRGNTRMVGFGSSLYLDPESMEWNAISHNINDTFTVQVRVTNVTDLGAIQFYLRWDPTILRLIQIEEGDLLKARGYTGFWLHSALEIDKGYIMAGHCLLPTIPGLNIEAPDSGLVATLTFQAINFTDRTQIYFINTLYGKNFWIPVTYIRSLFFYFEYMMPATFIFKKE